MNRLEAATNATLMLGLLILLAAVAAVVVTGWLVYAVVRSCKGD